MRKWVLRIREEISSFSQQERLFVLFAMLCGFFISSEYAIIRPVSNAIFLTAYGAKTLPFVWLATVPLNFLVVAFYNQYLPRLGCFKLFVLAASCITTVNCLSSLFITQIFWLPFVFYLWKEIYIMLMFQQLWSVIHLTVSFKRAKYLYGLFFAVGALGASLGSIFPGFFAVKMGSESLLQATFPLYLSLGVCYYFALKNTKEGIGLLNSGAQQSSSLQAFVHGLRMVTSSRYLTLILSIVVLMQVSSTLIDFQFNTFLEKTFIHRDIRTEYTGRILGLVHLVSISIQLIGSFVLIHYLGIRRSHLFVPILLGSNAILFQFFPWFGLISFSYISVKSCDFSLFTILKELLYIPLNADEKFRAKAVIDVFAHRSSKAIASTLILGLQTLLGSMFLPLVGWSCVALAGVWAILLLLFLKEPHQDLVT